MTEKNDDTGDLNDFWGKFKTRIAKKPDSFWIEIWRDVAIAAFFAGILVSYKIAAIQVNHQNEIMFEEIREELKQQCPALFINGEYLFPVSGNDFNNISSEQQYKNNNEDLNGDMSVIP